MIDHVMAAAQSLAPRTTTLVVGHMKELLRQGLERYPGLSFVTQEPQLGTGHALLQTAGVLERENGFVLLLSGDVPLLKGHTLAALVQQARGVEGGRNRPDGCRRSALRIRAHRQGEGTDFADCGRARRVAGAAENPGDQQRHLRVLAGSAVRVAARAGDRQRAGRVLSNGSRLDLSPPQTRRRDGRGRGSQRDSRHQQPVGTGRSEPNRETEKKRRADGGGRDDRRSRDDLHRR